MGRKSKKRANQEKIEDCVAEQDGLQPLHVSDNETNCSKDEYNDKCDAICDSLSTEEIKQFIEHGYVLLKSAFSKEAAENAREFLWERIAKDGISRDDPTTWTRRHGIAEVYWPSHLSPPSSSSSSLSQTQTSTTTNCWNDVITPKIYKAIDQLCGKKKTGPFGCGWWVVSFPHQLEPPWSIDGNWHIDGFGYHHYINSPEIGILPIFIFNDLGPGDGGTVLSARSHKKAAKLLWGVGDRGMEGGKLSSLVRKNIEDAEIIEIQGQAGDVMLVHPFMLHARGKNLGDLGVDSVRFMCHPAVPLLQPMNLNPYQNSSDSSCSNNKDLNNDSEIDQRTPLEESILIVKNDPASDLSPYVIKSTCDNDPNDEKDALEVIMGFNGFKKKKKLF